MSLLSREELERAHCEKVANIARQLRTRASNQPVSLRKRAVSHAVPKARDLARADAKIDVSALTDILAIDPVSRTCVAESGVTFVDLVAATMRHGLVPIVVPELETITIGGAVAGCSIESTSFRFGGFHDTCLAYEVLTANGDVLVCTPENENKLVFQMLHGTFGTLGILTKLEFRLMPAKPYVEVTYQKFARLEEYLSAIWREFETRRVDFMDGILHAPTDLVLSTARFVDEAPYASRYDWTKVYYRSTRERSKDYLRTRDYFYRYDHGVTNVHPKSFLGRLVLGKFMGSSRLLRLAETFHRFLPAQNPDVILDVFLPFSKVGAFFEWYRREFDFFPLWCVPFARVREYEWLSSEFYRRAPDRLFLDLAIYGMKQVDGRNAHVMIEQKLLELGGMKTLISENHFSESEFWSIWNKPNYDAVKAITDPQGAFRNLFVKMCRVTQGIPG